MKCLRLGSSSEDVMLRGEVPAEGWGAGPVWEGPFAKPGGIGMSGALTSGLQARKAGRCVCGGGRGSPSRGRCGWDPRKERLGCPPGVSGKVTAAVLATSVKAPFVLT